MEIDTPGAAGLDPSTIVEAILTAKILMRPARITTRHLGLQMTKATTSVFIGDKEMDNEEPSNACDVRSF